MLPLSMNWLAPVLVALVLMPPPAGAAEMKEVACKETLLCSEVLPGDAALFDRYFGTAAAPVAEGWDAENLVQFSSSWQRNKAGKQVLCERLMILAEDGSTLRKLFCERFETNPAKRVNYKELKYRAVVPFVFAYNLVGIVGFDDETLYLDCVQFNPQSRRIEGIESRHWTRRELYSMRGELTEEDKTLFGTCFPRHKWRRTPPHLGCPAAGAVFSPGAHRCPRCLLAQWQPQIHRSGWQQLPHRGQNPRNQGRLDMP